MDTANRDENMESLEKDIMRKTYIPRIKPIMGKPLDEETAENLFRAYFNNKMTVILMLLQKKNSQVDPFNAMRASIFLEDLYHHMLRRDYQNSHGRVFQWLRIFFKHYPAIRPVQKRKAIEYIRVIYQLFGVEWRLGI